VAPEDIVEAQQQGDSDSNKASSLSSSSSEGIPIAKGSIVTTFRGGLVAARVDDDLHVDSNEPQVVDTTKMEDNKKQAKSSNTIGGDLIGRQVLFDNGQRGVVMIHRPPMIFVYAESDDDKSSNTSATLEGSVTVLSNLFSIQIPENLRHTDCFGRSAMKETSNLMQRPIFAPIPQVKDIALINKPLVTGVTMFDALAPIGKGQNMLLIGHDIDDMRRYVTDILSIQTKETPATKCVYASTGNAEQQAQIQGLLEAAGVDKDVLLVSSDTVERDDKDDASCAAEATVVAATACSIAESFATQQGMDTLVIVDTIDQHKKIWDTTTRVLVDVFGVDSVVKSDRDGGASSEMRAFFSSLVQRSAQFKSKRGGGSVTLLLMQTIPKLSSEKQEEIAFSPEDFEQSPDKIKERINLLVQKEIPLTAANLRKIQIPVPSADEGIRRLVLQHVDDLISMSDGQIWLDERLEETGRRPAMDFQRSVTRIGIGADTVSRADAAAMRRVVEGLRLDLSQAESMDGAELATNASKKQMRNAQAWLLAMHQPSASGARKLSESCVAMLAASSGALNDSIENGILPGTAQGESLIRDLLDCVSSVVPDAMAEIDSKLDFGPETKKSIEEAIQSYFQ
jgi:F-type H+-transporting ATPase subunit alpha